MGSRSLQQTGAKMTGEMLVVEGRAWAGHLLGTRGFQRCWCVCAHISVGGKVERKHRRGMGLHFTENPFPRCSVICCFQFFLRNPFLGVCI